MTERRRFWERVFRGRFASLMQAGNETAAQKILEDELDNPGSTGGEIILVGSRAGRCRFADAARPAGSAGCGRSVLRPPVTDGVRELIRRDAEQICVGKRAGNTPCRSTIPTRC